MASDVTGKLVTVTGAIDTRPDGIFLPHEHLLLDFIGADQVDPGRYDADEAFEIILPHLKRARQCGVSVLAECTPAYLARDPQLLRRLSQASGVALLTNTGYYGAFGKKALPKHAFEESAEKLATRWTAEWRDGIGGSDIKPGFIKIGLEGGAPLSEIHRKLVRAAALTHRQTGLTIGCHTSQPSEAMEALEIIQSEGVAGEAMIWIHAQNAAEDEALLARAADAGLWIELDWLAPETVTKTVELIKKLKALGYMDRVLVSHDAGWYTVGEPKGGAFRGFGVLATEFIPALREAWFDEYEIQALTEENPWRALTAGLRLR